MPGWMKPVLIVGALVVGLGVFIVVAFAIKYSDDKDLYEVDELDEISNTTEEDE